MNEHEQIQEMFSEYLEKSLPSEERRKVDEHLGQCASCQDALAALGRTLESVHELPRIRAPRGFAKRLQQRAQMSGLYQRRHQAERRLLVPHLALLAFVLLLAILGMLVMVMLLSDGKKPVIPSPTPANSSSP